MGMLYSERITNNKWKDVLNNAVLWTDVLNKLLLFKVNNNIWEYVIYA